MSTQSVYLNDRATGNAAVTVGPDGEMILCLTTTFDGVQTICVPTTPERARELAQTLNQLADLAEERKA